MAKIKVDRSFLEELCKLAGNHSINFDDFSDEDINSLLESLKDKVSLREVIPDNLLNQIDPNLLDNEFSLGNESGFGLGTDSNANIDTDHFEGDTEQEENKPAVLLIDDLGVIIYQLNIVFQKMNMETVTAKEIFDALEKFKSRTFEWVIMDLFIPTDREGLMLLAEMSKLRKLNHLDTQIVVITASAKKEYKKLCLKKGANYFLEKTIGWQKRLQETCFEKRTFKI